MVLKLPLNDNEDIKNLGIQLEESDPQNPVINVLAVTVDEINPQNGNFVICNACYILDVDIRLIFS